jgi:hypothetical protein
MVERSAARKAVLAILIVAGLARIILALLGGQHHYGDELRYYRGSFVAVVLFDGKTESLGDFGATAAHTGFTVLTSALAPFHWSVARLAGRTAQEPLGLLWSTPQIGAALLGLFSTLNLWLIYRVARRAGADREESLWAMLFAAGSLTLFVYSRHLLPYDASLSFFLAALLLGFGRGTPARAALSGAAAGFAFTVYNGHWELLPLVAAILAWHRHRTGGLRFPLVLAWLGGTIAGLSVGYVPAVTLGHGTLFTGVDRFAGTIRDGEFSEGWSLPWEFLWNAESWLGVAILGLALWGALRPQATGRARQWLLGAGVVYAGLVVMSVGLEKFVVYARTVRPMVPFLCLAAGAGMTALLQRAPRWKLPALVFVTGAAALNFAPLFPQQYPMELDRKVHQLVGVPQDYLTFLASWDKRDHPAVTRPDLVLVNTYSLFGFVDHRDYPEGQVLLDVPHPLALRFYQYDGHSPAQRALLRAHEPRMKLIRLSKPLPGP